MVAQKQSGKRAALTDKQERFAQELIKGKSQREAYRIAYPTSLKWSDKTVDETACRLFNNPKVHARYDQLHDRLVKEAEDECIVDAKMVLKELANVAFANGSDFAKVVEKSYMQPVYDADGKKTGNEEVIVKDVDLALTDDLPPEKKKAISAIKQTKYGIVVETCDKVKALELLGKHLKLFTDKVETEVNGNINNPLSEFTTEELRELLKK